MSVKCRGHAKQRHGEPCEGWAMKGRDVCYHHGGKSRLGAGSGTYKRGRYSKFLPSRMAADQQALLDDPKLLELAENIATVDARIIDLFKRVDHGEAGGLWRSAQEAFARLRQEQARNNPDGMMLALAQAERAIAQGAGDYQAWDELSKQFELRRKLCDSENRRITQAHEVLNANEAMVLMSQVVSTVQKHVLDLPQLLTRYPDDTPLAIARRILGGIAAEMQGTVLMRQGANGYE
jgi:hypothetical protein